MSNVYRGFEGRSELIREVKTGGKLRKVNPNYVDKRNLIKTCYYPASSNIWKIEVEKLTNKVTITFKRTLAKYVYDHVEKEIWQRLTNLSYIRTHFDGSIGTAFHKLLLTNVKYVNIYKVIHLAEK